MQSFHLHFTYMQSYIYIYMYIQEEIDLPGTLTVPIKNHKTAHNAPKIEMKKNPLFLLLLLALVEPFTAVLIACILNLLKLDIRSNARFTNGLSAAEAGAVGIESTNDHIEDENQLPTPLPSFLLYWSCLGPSFTKPKNNKTKITMYKQKFTV